MSDETIGPAERRMLLDEIARLRALLAQATRVALAHGATTEEIAAGVGPPMDEALPKDAPDDPYLWESGT